MGDTEHPAPAQRKRAATLEARITELQRVYGRIEGNVTSGMATMNIVILVVGGTLVAARFAPAVVALIPLFWSAMYLYALTIDQDTRKFGAYARALERRINAELADEVFVWESRLSSRGRFRDPIVYRAAPAYYVLLLALSWVAGFLALRSYGVALVQQVLPGSAAPLAMGMNAFYVLLGAAILATGAFTKSKGHRVERSVQRALEGGQGDVTGAD